MNLFEDNHRALVKHDWVVRLTKRVTKQQVRKECKKAGRV